MLKIVFGIAAGFVLDVPLRRILPKGLYGGYEAMPMRWTATKNTRNTAAFPGGTASHAGNFCVHLGVQLYHWADLWLCRGRFRRGISGHVWGIFQPMMAALIGLVPNCGASVLLAQLYMGGAITFGSFFAGLCSGAGIGLAVLWRVNPSWKQNLFMTGLLWFCGTCCGILLQWVV